VCSDLLAENTRRAAAYMTDCSRRNSVPEIPANMIEVYKILNNKYDSCVNLYLEQLQNTRTRGHDLKQVN